MATESQQVRAMLNAEHVPAKQETLVAGQPLDEFAQNPTHDALYGLESEQGLVEQPQGEPISYESSLERFQSELKDPGLFDTGGPDVPPLFAMPIQPQVGVNLASNRAHMDAIINNDSSSFDARKQAHLNGTVYEATVDRVQQLLDEQAIVDLGVLEPAHLASLTPEERLEAVQKQVARIDLRHDSVGPRDIALMEVFRGGRGDLRMPEFEQAYRQSDVTDLVRRKDQRVKEARQNYRHEIDDIAAAHSWNSYGEMFMEVGLQDFVPVMGLMTRIGLDRKILEAVSGKPVEGFGGFWLGEIRQRIRTELASQGPEEFGRSMQAFNELITTLKNDEMYSALLTKYNLIESMEAVFTDGVFDGTSAKNSGDRFFGNLETALEGVFSIVAIAKVGGTVRGAFRSMDKVRASQLASASGAPEVAGRLADEFQSDALAINFGLAPDEVAVTVLPRPAEFVDDIEVLSEGSKDVLVRTKGIRSEIEATTGDPTLALTKSDRTNVVNQEIRLLDLADDVAVQPRMSTLQKFEDGSGFRMRVVVGADANGGFDNIKDVMLRAIDIDPDLQKVTIHRVGANGRLEPVFMDADEFQRALFKQEVDSATAGRIAGGDTIDETFYLVYDTDRYYHNVDKTMFGADSVKSASRLAQVLLAPNARFGDEIYGNFLKAYMDEEALSRNFDLMFKPYYELGRKDKKFVASAFEWMEDFGKNNGRAPTHNEVLVQYDQITEAQMNGIIALREGMDTMHDLFNRRLYRDFHARGLKTARPVDNTLPTFHGKNLEAEQAKPGYVLNPETQKMERLSKKQVKELYEDGGSIMELDTAIDAANEAGNKATRVVLRKNAYEAGELSTTPLIYHPGYSMRFYDDPYYVVKKSKGVRVDGSYRKGASSVVTEAVRTSGTAREAARFAERANRAAASRGWDSEFEVVRANDISKTESSIFQKQSIQREGRMFWDDRNFERLPDTNGSRAKLEDPVTALERGIGLAARQLTHEDLLKSVKNAWTNQYKHLFDTEADLDLIKSMDLKAVSQRLGTMRANTAEKAARAEVNKAKALIDYFRLIEGSESAAIPIFRETMIGLAQTIDRWTNPKFQRGLEKWAMTTDPLRTMRSAAFHAFMVFRPIRQALLQASQIGLLAPLDPKYVGSGAIFRDAYALSQGVKNLRKAGFIDESWSLPKSAKAMGLSKSEFRLLVRQFDRSGLGDLVDVHSFAGGAARFQKTRIGEDGMIGAVGYKARQLANGTTGALQKMGFDKGEKYNVMLTYNLALRRAMKRNNYKSLKELSAKDWDDLRVESSNLSLGMARPNNFTYQTGHFSLATQFLSFSHKSALALMNLNPAIKGMDTVKLLFGSYMLYGANMYGARDEVEAILVGMGLEDREIPGMSGATLVDLISGGLIDTTFNLLGQATIDDWKPLEFGPLAPGIDVSRIFGQTLTELVTQPAQAIFGPFGNIFSKTLTGMQYAVNLAKADSDIAPADKFTKGSAMILSGAFPMFNDVMKSYMGYQLNRWYSTSLEALPLRPTMNAMLARSLLGVRTREELAYYRTQNEIWEQKDQYNGTVKGIQTFLNQQITLFSNGELTEDQFMSNQRTLMNFFEEWPEGIRLQLLKDVMVTQRDDDSMPTIERQFAELVLNKKFDETELLSLIDRFPDIPKEKREHLKMVIKEAWASKLAVEQKIGKEIGATE